MSTNEDSVSTLLQLFGPAEIPEDKLEAVKTAISQYDTSKTDTLITLLTNNDDFDVIAENKDVKQFRQDIANTAGFNLTTFAGRRRRRSHRSKKVRTSKKRSTRRRRSRSSKNKSRKY